MPVFPSVEWFQALRDVVNQDDEYRHFGTCDAVVGIKVDDRLFKLTFEAFDITEAAEIGPNDLRDCDFYLDMPYESWKEMLQNIRANDGADLEHTLNTLDLNLNQIAKSDDEYRRDMFYRYNQSFQQVFDDSRQVETEFAR